MTPERWRRVEEVFHGAVERDAASRERFLAEACAGDEALKRDVEALLSTDGEAADFIETPAAAALADEPAEAAKLAPGERLGPYEVASLIGRGGMGEVYRARDTRLGRDVAIKVLPSLMASDPDRLRRLELEARTTGMLNHPNILSIHDTGVHGGSAYLVTELLSGKTLRELLAGGALPARRALDVAAQTARGLAAAHDKGIVHRDLKPENLFVTKEGLVKILDFGLAKLTGPRIASGSATGAATVSARTATGMILGTAGYMSPEQVRGQAVDHRSDVFAFGAILYEMLTGRRAFAGDSAVETMHAILKEEPPEPEPDLRVPPALERIVRRCLEKSPEHRFQSARDVGFALEAFGAPTGSGEAVAGPRPARAPTSRTAVLTALAAASVAALAAALLTARATRTEPPVFTRITFRRGTIASARFSPDGQTIVYAGAFSGRPAELFATRPGSPESRSFDLPEAEILGISSAGEMAIRLASEWTLARVPLVGGAPREVAHGVQAADFSPDGESLAAVRWEGDHPRLEYPLGTRLYDSPNELSSPCVSPDGGSVAFLESPSRFSTSSLVCIVDRAGRRRVLSSEAGWNGGLG
ncbi:MAG TPA: serine/threonine-protein kinase, partial [Thermoanaerobaculia bacterium]|nr:serine/threonine-protein kinase [Thermoanaerobaculia bacterium]